MLGKLKQLFTKLSGKMSRNHRDGLFGVGWSGLSQVIGLVVKLGSTLILTRLLAPSEYGILGTAMAVLTTLEWLSDLGIQPALIRHEKGADDDYLLTGWWMGLGRGAFLSAMAALCAVPLASFYQQPELLGVLLVLASRPVLLALRSPAFPTLRKHLNFKGVFIDEVATTVVGTACSIAMAFWLRSVWAIVLGIMAGVVVSVVLSYWLVPMRPRFAWSRDAAKDLYGLGRQVFVNTLVMAAWLNLDRLLGLRLLTPTEMGLYAIAFNLSAVLEGLITRICDVYFSMLAKESPGDAQQKWHTVVCERVSSWGMPVMAASLLLAPWAVWILYDPRYHGAGIVFSILLARLMVRTLGQLQFQYLLALAQVRIATYAYLVAVCVQFALFWPLVETYGVAGMAIAVLISTTALTLTQSFFIYRHEGDSLQPFFKTCSWAATGLACVLFVYGAPPTRHPTDFADQQNVTTPQVADDAQTEESNDV